MMFARLLLITAFLPASLYAAEDEAITPEAVSLGRAVSFQQDIAPIFQANCVACHNKSKAEGQLNLESGAAVLKGGSSGEVIVPGKPDDSYLYNVAARIEESFMPPLPNGVQAKALTPKQVGLLKQWILEGAKVDQSAAATVQWQAMSTDLKAVYATDIDQHGRFVAAGRAGNVAVYDLKWPGEPQTLVDETLQADRASQRTHRDYVHAVAFDPHGDVLATAGYQVVKLWQRDVAGAISEADPETAKALVAAAGPFKLTEDRTALQKGDAEAEPIALGGPTRSVAVVGETLVCLKDDGTVELRNVADAALAVKKAWKIAPAPQSVELASGGLRLLAFDANGMATLWNTADGKRLAELKTDQKLQRAAADAKTEQAVRDARVKVGNAQVKAATARVTEQQESLKKVEAELKKAVDALAAAKKKEADQTPLTAAAVKASEEKPEDAGLKKKREAADKALADAKEGVIKAEKTKSSQEKSKELTQAAIARAEQVVKDRNAQVAAATKRAAAAKTAAEAAAKTAAAAQPVTHVCFVNNDVVATLVATATGSNIQFWSAESGAVLDRFELSLPDVVQAKGVSNQLLLKCGDGKVFAMQPKPRWVQVATLGPKPDGESEFSDRVLSLAFSPDGKMLATGGGEASRSGEVLLWNVAERKLAVRLDEPHSDTVYGLDFSLDGEFVASAAADKFVKVFRVTDGTHVRNFEGHTHHVMDVSWNGDGTKLASAGADNAIKVWNADTGEQARTITTYSKQVTALEFVGMADEFVSSSGDKRVFRHRASNGGTVREFKGSPDYVYCSATTPDGSLIAAGCEDGALRIWDGANGKVLQTFEQK